MGKIVYNGREYLSAGTASTMQGATSTTDGVSGLVPQPLITDKDKVLKGDGTWGDASEIEANPSGTATDELKKIDIDGTIYDINKSYLVRNAFIYSTDEIQVGVWTDEKPLYQKVIFDTSTDTSGTEVHIDLSSLNIETMVIMWGYFDRNTSGGQSTYYFNMTETPQTPNYWGIAKYQNALKYIAYRIAINSGTTSKQTFVIYYTKTTDAAGSGGYQAYGFSPIIYSETEREVGVWVNNKPLYQKSINIGVLTKDSSFHYVAHNIANIDEIVDVNGVYQRDDGSTYRLNLMRPTTTNAIMLGADATNIQYMNTQQDDARYKAAWVTLYYTKTTDVAGSGSYNTLGVPNVHYSTDEQVIGTWFGETLYETTLDLGSERVFSSGWNSVVAHQNKYNLIFDGKLISPSKLGYNVDLACNDTTNLELHTNYNIQGRYLTFKYTKTS